MRLAKLTQPQLDAWVTQVRHNIPQGALPDSVPLLAQVNPSWVAVAVSTIEHPSPSLSLVAGDAHRSFALMSVIKPFLLLFLLEQLGAELIFRRVGMEPSDRSFHSLTQLTHDRGWPRNPMLNSGAILLASLMLGRSSQERCQRFCEWLNFHAQTTLSVEEAMLASVCSLPNERNRALTRLLRQAGCLHQEDIALSTYNRLCCLSGTVSDLVRLGLLLVQPQMGISPIHQRIVKALMLTCGLYEASSAYAVRLGLPTKSGVSGAVLSAVPGQGAIACYSPLIDPIGNSVAGLSLLEIISQSLDLSIFS